MRHEGPHHVRPGGSQLCPGHRVLGRQLLRQAPPDIQCGPAHELDQVGRAVGSLSGYCGISPGGLERILGEGGEDRHHYGDHLEPGPVLRHCLVGLQPRHRRRAMNRQASADSAFTPPSSSTILALA